LQRLTQTCGAERTPSYSEQASALKTLFCEARKACVRNVPIVIFVRPQKRPTPYPLILVSLGKSRTRRVPAPSRLAQRDVAKTHVSPGQ